MCEVPTRASKANILRCEKPKLGANPCQEGVLQLKDLHPDTPSNEGSCQTELLLVVKLHVQDQKQMVTSQTGGFFLKKSMWEGIN